VPQQQITMKTTPDPTVLSSWVQELKRLETLATAIGTRREPIGRLIELHHPPQEVPAGTAATTTRKATKVPGPTMRPTTGPTRSRRPTQPGATSKLVLATLPIGPPGISQKDLQVCLPGSEQM
jgi:hypothetical protein